MASERRLLRGRDFIAVVCKALDIDDTMVRRVIISADVDDVVVVYVTHIGDDRLLQVDWNSTLKEVKKADTSEL